MNLPRDLVGLVRRLDEYQLRRLLILVRGLLMGSDGPAIELDDVPGMPAVTYRSQHVRCGKACGSCPHGPYWYAFWKEGGRSRSQYIGNVLPAEVRQILEQHDADQSPTPEDYVRPSPFGPPEKGLRGPWGIQPQLPNVFPSSPIAGESEDEHVRQVPLE